MALNDASKIRSHFFVNYHKFYSILDSQSQDEITHNYVIQKTKDKLEVF